MPLSKRRSRRRRSSRDSPSGKTGVPPPTVTGHSRSSTTSTSPSRRALPARVGPSIVRSPDASDLARSRAAAVNSRSSRVRSVQVRPREEEKTIFSARFQVSAKRADSGDHVAADGSVSQTAMVSYMRRP